MMEHDGVVYWKSLEDLRAECQESSADRQEFLEPTPWKARTHPAASVNTTRRDFLSLMGFTLGAAACSRPPAQHAVPFVNAREDLTPGVANWYATTCGGCSAGCSVLVKTRDGRPIKIEGNPDSPLFRGGTCAVGQATVLSLYDGERLRQPVWEGQQTSWTDVDDRIEQRLAAGMGAGRRVVLLSGTISSPSTRDLIRRWSSRYPQFQHVVYEPVSCAAIRRAYDACFGQAIVPHYRFDQSALTVGLEVDFLGTWLSPVEFTSQYARRREPGPASFPIGSFSHRMSDTACGSRLASAASTAIACGAHGRGGSRPLPKTAVARVTLAFRWASTVVTMNETGGHAWLAASHLERERR
jgi:MoCo/4Fe-4S cofactor protein with predicted Tat translocation signal